MERPCPWLPSVLTTHTKELCRIWFRPPHSLRALRRHISWSLLKAFVGFWVYCFAYEPHAVYDCKSHTCFCHVLLIYRWKGVPVYGVSAGRLKVLLYLYNFNYYYHKFWHENYSTLADQCALLRSRSLLKPVKIFIDVIILTDPCRTHSYPTPFLSL